MSTTQHPKNPLLSWANANDVVLKRTTQPELPAALDDRARITALEAKDAKRDLHDEAVLKELHAINQSLGEVRSRLGLKQILQGAGVLGGSGAVVFEAVKGLLSLFQ